MEDMIEGALASCFSSDGGGKLICMGWKWDMWRFGVEDVEENYACSTNWLLSIISVRRRTRQVSREMRAEEEFTILYVAFWLAFWLCLWSMSEIASNDNFVCWLFII